MSASQFKRFLFGALADGSPVEILNVIDDHSRLLVGASAFRTVRAGDVVGVFHDAAQRCGYPAALLSDNAAVFSGGSRQGKVLLESELEHLGIRPSHARPYHPQTCGKVERLHQTEKRWLQKQPSAATLAELSAQLDRFRVHYNLHRPHRGVGRRTPQEVFDARVKAGPGSRTPPVHYRVRYDTVDWHGKVTLRYDSRLHHIGLGMRHRGKSIVLFVADRDVRSSMPTASSCVSWCSIRRAITSGSRPEVYDGSPHRLRCRDTSQSGQRGV